MEEEKEERPKEVIRVQIHVKEVITYKHTIEITEKEFMRLDSMNENDLIEALTEKGLLNPDNGNSITVVEITRFLKEAIIEQDIEQDMQAWPPCPIKEFVDQSNVDINYCQAIQDGKFALLKNLARYLGKKMGPSIAGRRYLWKNPDGLYVYFNETEDFILATYKKEVVASSIQNNPLFIPGTWWEIIEQIKSQVGESMKQAEAAKLKIILPSLTTAA